MRYRVILIICLAVPEAGRLLAQESADFVRCDQQAYLSQVLGCAVPDDFNAPLFFAVSEWLGAPYRYAGSTPEGVDCSAFVRKVFDRAYGASLAGNSHDLFAATVHVKTNGLQQGDLVFFRTRRHRVAHVGIYLGEGLFAHSSRSRGVVISRLQDAYYRSRFAGGGRPALPDAGSTVSIH